MDQERLKRVIRGQALRAGFDSNTVDGLIEDALTQAGPYLWNSYKWRFRRRETTITMTSSQEYVELPDDFSHFYSLTHSDGTSEGWQLTYQDEDVYEYQNPNPSVNSEDGPQSVKIVYDSDNDVWKAYLSPIPDSAYTPSLIYFTKYGGWATIPEGFEKVALAACWMFMYAPGSDSYGKTEAAYQIAKMEAINDIDPVFQGEPSHVKRARRFDPEGSNYVSDDWYKVSDGSDY